MKKMTVAFFALVTLAGCASGVVDPAAPEAVAHVELVNIEPPAGSIVSQNTVLIAEIQYSVENFNPRVNYYLAPLFASTHGTDQTFNAHDRITQSTPVTSPSGTVIIRYRIEREWRSSELERPVRVWFYLMERTGARTTRVIGKTSQIAFQ